ncbi:MAG TPA: alpha/beta hydrolase [Puia sp.]|jgi:pimeloyl-ACP methyl ester carboxylesterase|nr:alpha/beta hydrolase [Puia sp.]
MLSFNKESLMESFFISYKSSQIHYYKAGAGDKLLLCFHGYGEFAESFSFLEKSIANDFTLLAIDFPFHGKTIWNEELVFTPEDLVTILEKIIEEASFQNSKISLLGFSMGGRVALHLLQSIPTKIEKIILLAPDGLKINFWYWLATQTSIGNKLFYFTANKPSWFFLLMNTADKLRLVNQSVFKFANHYLHDKQMRNELYDRWTVMRQFKPNIKKIKQDIRANNIQLRLLYGRFDKVIRYKNAEKFMNGIESNCILSIINSGHELLKEKNADEIIRLIKTD